MSADNGLLTNLAKVHNLSKNRDAEILKKLETQDKKIDEILALIKSQKTTTP